MDHNAHPAIKRSRPDSGRAQGFNATSQAGQLDKAIVNKWLREDLEDKYLNLYQDHHKLKEKFREQDEKIKEFKLVLKKKQDQIRQQQVRAGAGASELRATDQVVKLEMRNVELERLNSQLQQKVTLLRSQISGTAASSKRPISAGVHSSTKQRGSGNIRLLQPPPHPEARTHSLARSDDMKNERTRLQMVNSQLQVEVEALKERLFAQEADSQRRIQEMQSDLDIAKLQVGGDKRLTMQEDLDKVRLQRELREKAAVIEHLQARGEANEEKMRDTLESNTRCIEELERMKREIRAKDSEIESLRETSSVGQTSRRRVMELEQALDDASKEAKILKDANDKLTNSAFDTERERQWKTREAALVTQIRQLEATMRRDCGEKGEFLNQLEEQRDHRDGVEKELSSLRIKYYELQQQHESLRDRMKFFTKESAVDLNEVEEALVLVKQRRQQSQPSELDFLQEVDTEVSRETQRRLQEVEAAHADTIQELDKTRQLLEAQHRINQDLKASHGLAESRLDEVKADSEQRMAEYAKLLDIRAARIRKLERQLRDVAYGTKQFGIDTAGLAEADAIEEVDETVHLRNGENLVEFHVGRLLLSDEGRRLLGDAEPSLFCTWAFYMCELQTSGVVRAAQHDFDKTVQYVVKVEDSFLHYINKEKVKVELFQSVGMQYHSVGASRISFRELLDAGPTTPVHGKASLLNEAGDSLGVLEFWFRMRVPMEQAMRLYRERAKALGYMSANHQQAAEGMRALDDTAEQRRPGDSCNDLNVKIVRCGGLRGRRPDFQPSPYCTFKFFDGEDSVTPAIPNSEDPEFHFHQRLNLQLSPELDKYLRTQKLVIYVLDEADPDEAAAFLGVARVELISLSRNRAIQGTYQLLGPSNEAAGTIDLEFNWQFAYLPPASWQPAAEPLPLMTGEAEFMQHQQQQQSPSRMQQQQLQQQSPNRMKQQQQQQQQRPPQPAARAGSRNGSRGSSRAGSVVDETCVERVQGVDAAAYRRQHRPQQQLRGDSAAVAEQLRSSLTAPPDQQLPPSDTDPDADSVTSEVHPEQRRDSPTDTDARLRQLQQSADTQASISAAPDASVTDSITSITETNGRNGGGTAVDDSTTLHPHYEDEEEEGSKYEQPEFEPEYEEDEYEENDEEEEEEEEEEEAAAEGESDGLVVEDESYRLSSTGPQAMSKCTVEIFSVHFNEDASVLKRPGQQETMTFVSFALPGYHGESCETPVSLPTPKLGLSKPNEFDLVFNFQRNYEFDFDDNYNKRRKLAALLLLDKIEVPFNVVCEAKDADNDYFDELAKATLRLDPLAVTAEVEDEFVLPLIADGSTVGTIKVSTTLPNLLLDIYNELPEEKKQQVKVVQR